MKNDTPVVLSVSMLTSGKKDMKKSLESLRALKNRLSCEIILVDTGCNEEQRRLIEGYGDKIVDFTWCNDFAAARNAGLREARGEWFLYLDDDEWFEDPQEIITFFRMGEYKNYSSATYIQRNYLDPEGDRYVDNYVARMVRLSPETRFEGMIHEYLTPFREPRKSFTVFVHHYGYVYENEADKAAHARRNIAPLLEMRRRCPGDARWISSLIQEYYVNGEFERAFEECKRGLEECRRKGKEGVKYAGPYYGAIYAYILAALECLDRYDEEESWLVKAMSHPLTKMKAMAPTTAFYCLMGARLYALQKKHEQCRSYLRRYLDYFYQLRDDREAVENGTATVVTGVFQTQNLNGILACVESLIRLEDYAFAEETFYLLDWTDKRLLHQEVWERNIVDACCSVTYHSLWVRMLQTLVSREEGMKEMLVVFLEREIAYRAAGDEKKLSRLYRLVAELDYEHRYILCARILREGREADGMSGVLQFSEGLDANGTGKLFRENASGLQGFAQFHSQKIADLFRQLFEKYPKEILGVRDEIWAVADSRGIAVEALLLQMDLEQWKQNLNQWSEDAETAELQRWDMRIGRWKTRADVRYDLFAVKCIEGYLRHCREFCSEPAQLEDLLWRYSDKVLALRKSVEDTGGAVAPAVMLSPTEILLAEKLRDLRQHREQKDDKRTLESIKKCLGIYPAMDPAILTYAEILRDEVKRRSQKAEEEQTELVRLVAALKAAARQQMESNNYSQAKNILLQVQQCVPEDEEVKGLLEKIMEHKGN